MRGYRAHYIRCDITEVDVALIECEDEWSNERKSNLGNLVSLPLVSAFHRRPLTLILPLRLKLPCLRIFYQSVPTRWRTKREDDVQREKLEIRPSRVTFNVFE